MTCDPIAPIAPLKPHVLHAGRRDRALGGGAAGDDVQVFHDGTLAVQIKMG